MKALLDKLNIQAVNPGVCTGPNGWLETSGPLLTSYNPTTGEPLAKIQQATPESYAKVVDQAKLAFQNWRLVPAPKRGEVIRDVGNALRDYKEPLGDLVGGRKDASATSSTASASAVSSRPVASRRA
jgi:aldehyde dehydrogenase (NAD+)